MLQKFIFILCCTVSFQSELLISATQQDSIKDSTQQRPGEINWLSNYEEGLQKAKAESKPLILFFTGSDWCTWCQKLDEEVLKTPEFASMVKDKFIFVKLDTLMYKPQSEQIKAQNKQLQAKFNVRSFPTLLIIDQRQGQQIGSTGYRPGGGKVFGEFLLRLLNDYSNYQNKMGSLEQKNHSVQDLIKLYEQAKKLNLPNDMNRIVKCGMESSAKEAQYFFVERYRFYADEGLIHTPEAKALRQRLLAFDPTNAQHIPYQIAVIDFETFCEEAERENYSTELTISPLVAYMEKYGNTDKENLWRLQMFVSQVYLDKNQVAAALQYAEASYESAPETAKAGIAPVVENIRSHCSLTQVH